MSLSCTCTSESNSKALESLLDAFGSVCSLEKVTSVYCKSKHDINRAGEILCQLQGNSSASALDTCNGEIGVANSGKFLPEDAAHSSTQICKNQKRSKQKKQSTSAGSVSGILGKAYTQRSLVRPVGSQIIDGKRVIRNKDVEDFLFSMLGDGFGLNIDVIREALSQCGYDMEKSIENLLMIAEKTLDKGKGIEGGKAKPTDCYPKIESCLSERTHPDVVDGERNLKEPSSPSEEKCNFQRQVLEAIFTTPKRSEMEAERKRHLVGLNRTRVVGQKPVRKPQDGIAATASTVTTKLKDDIEDDVDEEDKYMFFRRAMKQNWDAMKAYYDAAVDAFIKNDKAKANYLMEQGKYYNKMAREADEKSAGAIFDPRNSDIQKDAISLDLHDHPSKDAIHLLKFHLHKLACIPSIQYLKVTVDTDVKDITKGKRKRRIIELLEKESIHWVEEEGNPGTILISLHSIDREKLSFVNGTRS